MKPDEYWKNRRKREDQNVIIGLIIAGLGIAVSGLMQNIIPFIIAVLLAGFIYQRDQ